MGTAKNQSIQTGYLHKRSDNFGKIPVELLHDKTITEGAKLLYCHMHWRYGSNCDNHEGRSSMGDFLGVSEATITKRATELVAKDWIIALPRTDSRGRTSNFYHVFEVQEDCIKWRTDHDKPKPEIVLEPRKVRRGVGGRKTHKPKVSKETQVNPGEETQVNEPSKPEFLNPVNSSSHDPDSYDPDSVIHTSLSQVAPMITSEASATDEKPAVTKAAKPKPPLKTVPKKPAINQSLKDAIAIHLQGLAPNEAVAVTGLLANIAMKIWGNKQGIPKLSAEEYENVARSIPDFVKWFWHNFSYADTLPTKLTTFEQRYQQFVSGVNPKQKPKSSGPFEPFEDSDDPSTWLDPKDMVGAA